MFPLSFFYPIFPPFCQLKEKDYDEPLLNIYQLKTLSHDTTTALPQAIVWDEKLAGPFSMVADYTFLRTHDVCKMFYVSSNKLPPSTVTHVIFLTRPLTKLMDLINQQLRMCVCVCLYIYVYVFMYLDTHIQTGFAHVNKPLIVFLGMRYRQQEETTRRNTICGSCLASPSCASSGWRSTRSTGHSPPSGSYRCYCIAWTATWSPWSCPSAIGFVHELILYILHSSHIYILYFLVLLFIGCSTIDSI